MVFPPFPSFRLAYLNSNVTSAGQAVRPIGTAYPQPVYATMPRDASQSMDCLYPKGAFAISGLGFKHHTLQFQIDFQAFGCVPGRAPVLERAGQNTVATAL